MRISKVRHIAAKEIGQLLTVTVFFFEVVCQHVLNF